MYAGYRHEMAVVSGLNMDANYLLLICMYISRRNESDGINFNAEINFVIISLQDTICWTVLSESYKQRLGVH
jgi:hypothetical protein